MLKKYIYIIFTLLIISGSLSAQDTTTVNQDTILIESFDIGFQTMMIIIPPPDDCETTSVNPDSWTVGPAGGLQTFIPFVNGLCDWGLYENVSWLSSNLTSGSPPDFPTITCLPNTSTSSRNGNINFDGIIVNVTQEGKPEIPATPTIIISNCGNSVVSRGNPPNHTTWYWQTTSNGTDTTYSDTTYTIYNNSTVYLRAQHDDGTWSDSSSSIIVNVRDIPVLTVVGNPGKSINKGDSTILTANGADSYLWSPPEGLSSTDSSIVVANPLHSIEYTVTGTSTENCVSDTTVFVQVNISTTVNNAISSINVQAEGGLPPYNYEWNSGEIDTTAIYPSQSGNYFVTVKDQLGQEVHSDTINFIKTVDLNMNYVRVYSPLGDGDTLNGIIQEPFFDSENFDHNKWQISTFYYDGLGRPIQSVYAKASPSEKDIIAPIFYDSLGRRTKQHLPYTYDQENFTSSYRTNPFTEQEEFYEEFFPNEGQYAYSETLLESSPEAIVLKVGAPGSTWQIDHGHTVDFNYKTNKANTVKRFEVDNNGNLRDSSYYNPNVLLISEVSDENNHLSRAYYDLEGKILLKETIMGSDSLQTYYVYDKYGLLRYILPPQAVYEYNLSANVNLDSVTNLYGYYYEFDARFRMIKKKLPGADSVYIIYNKLNQTVLTQNGNMRQDSSWNFIKYDAFGRTVTTGMYKDIENISPHSLQTIINNEEHLWEYYNDTTHYYSNQAFPVISANCKIHMKSYYDSYDYINSLNNDSLFGYKDIYGNVITEKVFGIATTSVTYILDHSDKIDAKDSLISVVYFDDYGRIIQSREENHKGGMDVFSGKFNFVGDLLKAKQEHNIDSTVFVIEKRNTYDRIGRLLLAEEKISGENEWLKINKIQYDERGVTGVGIHSYDTTYIQTVNYKFNIRGWLTQINNPDSIGNDYFAMMFDYENSSNPQYNGNISSLSWTSKNFTSIKSYTYHYDETNKLTSADFSINQNYDVSYSYDKNGNIKTMQRYGKTTDNNFEIIDNLTYKYRGNQLISVDDGTGTNYTQHGFKENLSDTIEYQYDANGNMIKDKNKRIDEVTYNYINQPEVVSIPANGHTIYFTYTATGIKLNKTIDNDVVITDYVGNYVYENESLKYILTNYGKISVMDDTIFIRQYNITDHLGNVRITFSEEDTVLQENSYYPFGMNMEGLDYYHPSCLDNDSNMYLYNGKEIQQEFGLDWNDYGFRMYDAQLGRWHVKDALGEFYHTSSPYGYVSNDPINKFDILGLQEEDPGTSGSSNGKPADQPEEENWQNEFEPYWDSELAEGGGGGWANSSYTSSSSIGSYYIPMDGPKTVNIGFAGVGYGYGGYGLYGVNFPGGDDDPHPFLKKTAYILHNAVMIWVPGILGIPVPMFNPFRGAVAIGGDFGLNAWLDETDVGYIMILAGPDAGKFKSYKEITHGSFSTGASGGVELFKVDFSGNPEDFIGDYIYSPRYKIQIDVGFTPGSWGFGGGSTISWGKVKGTGESLIATGVSLGWGISPTIIVPTINYGELIKN